MSLLLNRAKEVTGTTGTGTINLNGAVIPIGYSKFQTWSAAGAVSGRAYKMLIEDGGDYEISIGTWTSGSPATLTRTLVESSTGSLLSLSGFATVSCIQETVELLGYLTFNGTGGAFSFSNIPPNFNTLELEVYGRVDTSATQNCALTVNGLTTSIYDLQRHYALSGTGGQDQALGGASWGTIIPLPGTAMSSGDIGGATLRITGYSGTTFNKLLTGLARAPNSNSAHDGYVISFSGQVRLTSAITSLTVTPGGSANVIAGSFAALRGIN